jgi:hypothetical protein
MSQLDIIDAKKALEARLKLWGIEVDAGKKAEGFIEDLVARGWAMSNNREARPHPPRTEHACRRCGGVKGDCACMREHRAVTYDDEPTPGRLTRDEALARMRADVAAARHVIEEADDE